MGNSMCHYSGGKSKAFGCGMCGEDSIHNSMQLSLSKDLEETHKQEGLHSSPKYIDSYNAYNNFFYLLNQIIYIQKAYKLHLRLKRKRSVVNKTCVPFNKISVDLNEDFAVNVEERVDRKRLNVSVLSNSITMLSDGPLVGCIRGYFLKKKKKYKYKGGLQGKKKQKFGRVTWEDGSVLYANFVNSRAEGICRYVDFSGMEFIGQYANNRPLGYGVFRKGDEVVYEGYWHNNILTGIGVEIWKDKTIYQGELLDVKKQGIGLYRWADGTIYQGRWENDQMTGLGIIIYPDERIYSGEVFNGVINGFGEFRWPDKKRYVGYYEEDKKEGLGLFLWSSEPFVAFMGFWQNGKQHGVGAKINDSQIKFGVWKDGKKHFWLSQAWEIKKFMKKTQEKYYTFFRQDKEAFIEAVKGFIF